MTATIAAGAFAYGEISYYLIPLRKQVFIELHYDFKGKIHVVLYNYNRKSVYVFGSYLYCSVPTKGGFEHFQMNSGDQINGVSVQPDTEKSLEIKLDRKTQILAANTENGCKISLMLNDYHGKSYSVAVPIAHMSFIIS